MPGDKTGKNLFMCIPPDHMRDDLPTDVTVQRLHGTGDSTFHADTPVFIGITDGMDNMVTLPCFGVRYVAGKGIVIMAHRTGRPVA